MHDSPKAAHFTASKNGIRLPPSDDLGLRVRWAVALTCPEDIDMMNLSMSDRLAIGNACAAANQALEDQQIVVQFRMDTPAPGIKVISAFGEPRIKVTDGQTEITIALSTRDVESLIDDLQSALDDISQYAEKG